MQKAGNRFFFTFSGKKGFLSERETHHLIKVCRKKIGDPLILIDGKGKEFLGKIISIKSVGKKINAEVEIIKLLREEKPIKPYIIAFLPILKGDKSKFLIEKGTELGIKKFVLFHSAHTIPKKETDKITPFREKAISALKQSGRLLLPEIEITEDLLTTLKNLPTKKNLRLLASPSGKMNPENLMKLLEVELECLYLLSGPEGGFSEKEIKEIKALDFHEIYLSPYILRAETAFLALLSIISFYLTPKFLFYYNS